MIRRVLLPFVLAFTSLLVACGPDEGDMLFLVHKGAEMPIWVRGNLGANTLVLVIHGGPGGTSFNLPKAPAFAQLEAQTAVAYWEQRGSGCSQGNVADATLTVAQFREDLDLVVDLLRAQYPDKEIYLLGYSWGGLLSALYLEQPAARAKVRGWIDLEGSVDVPLTRAEARRLNMARLDELVARGGDVATWKAMRAWYDAHPDITDAGDYLVHDGYIDRVQSALYGDYSAITAGVIFASPYSFFAYAAHGAYTGPIMLRQIMELDATPGLRDVTLPALVIQGTADGKVPQAVGEEVFARLGTPAADKQLVYFDGGMHSPYLQDPDKFAAVMTRFLERTR